MISSRHATRSCLTIFYVALVTFTVGISLAATVHAAERVLIWGNSMDAEHQPEFADDLQRDREALCMEEGAISMAWGQARQGISAISAELGLPADLEFEANDAYQRAADAVCRGEEIDLSSFSQAKLFIVYSHCSMFMRSTDSKSKAASSMSIFLNEGVGEALMYIRDPKTGKAYKVAINREMNAVRNPVPGEQGLFGPGRTTAANMERIGGPRAILLGMSDEMTGYEAYHYQYEYSSSLSGGIIGDMVDQANSFSFGQSPYGSLDEMSKVTTNGTAWIAPEAPGVAIINTFYDNFARIVEGQQGAMSFMAGMLRNQAAITSRGIPLSYVVDTESAMGMHSTSAFDAIDVRVIPARVNECNASQVPDDWEVMDLNEAMGPGAAGQPGMAGMSPQRSAKLAAAMQKMSPEQKKMMEQFGFGGVQMAPTGIAAAPATDTAAAKRSMPSSEELYSDNIAQMVQKHLQALGYDPGNTDGNVSTETIIAISQFQAEKGLEVTGEVSPQLAGILSAEVDERRN